MLNACMRVLIVVVLTAVAVLDNGALACMFVVNLVLLADSMYMRSFVCFAYDIERKEDILFIVKRYHMRRTLYLIRRIFWCE